MKLRSLLITILALFAMVLGGVVAQDAPMDPCLNLSAEDCAVITAASANGIGEASSFTIEIDLAFAATGLPDETTPSVDFAVSGAINLIEAMESTIPVNAGGSLDMSSSTLPEPMTIEFALVNDFAYFTDPTTGEWMGINLVTLLSSEEFASMFEGLMSGDTSALDASGMGAMPDMESLMPLLGILELPGLMDYTRDGDDFIFTIDLTALQALNAPENAEMLAALDAALTEADPSMAGMAAMLPMLISEGTIQLIQHVNTDLNIVDNIQLNANLAIAMGEEPTTIDLALNLAITNLDSAPSAEAPAEFTDMTDMISGMAASGQ